MCLASSTVSIGSLMQVCMLQAWCLHLQVGMWLHHHPQQCCCAVLIAGFAELWRRLPFSCPGPVLCPWPSVVLLQEQAAEVPAGGAAASARAAVRRRQLKKFILVTPADHWPHVDSGISMKQEGALPSGSGPLSRIACCWLFPLPGALSRGTALHLPADKRLAGQLGWLSCSSWCYRRGSAVSLVLCSMGIHALSNQSFPTVINGIFSGFHHVLCFC